MSLTPLEEAVAIQSAVAMTKYLDHVRADVKAGRADLSQTVDWLDSASGDELACVLLYLGVMLTTEKGRATVLARLDGEFDE